MAEEHMARRSPGKTFWFMALLPLLVGFDYGTKQAVSRSLPLYGEMQLIPGWLSVYHTENPYVAFSLPIPLPVIVVFGLVALCVMLWTFWSLPRDARVPAAALAAVMAGAMGNLLDRLGDGRVTDFVRVYTQHDVLAPWLVRNFGTSTWPIFNVADVCVLAGAVLWLLSSAMEKEQPAEVPGEDAA